MEPPSVPPGGWAHLIARFFQTLGARPLGSAERRWVEERLRPGEPALFFAQSASDQRHGFVSARAVERSLPGDPVAVRAALLHDVGKRHARLGTLGRVLASTAMALHLPLRGRWASYARHGLLGAAELAEAGAEPLVVSFARAHHGDRPPDIPQRQWEVLQAADQARTG